MSIFLSTQRKLRKVKVKMHHDDLSLSDGSSNTDDEMDKMHIKAREALEKTKLKQYPAFAVRSNIAFNVEYMSTDDILLPGHMISFGVKDFLHIKEPFNQDWWIARLVRIGANLGFIPSPAKIEAIRHAVYSDQAFQPTLNDANNSPTEAKDMQHMFNSFEENQDNSNINLNERPLVFNNQAKKQSTQTGPIQISAASRRLVPELDEEYPPSTDGQNVDGDYFDNNGTVPNNINKSKISQSAVSGGLGNKRKPFMKKLNMIQPYEIVPCMRPLILIGPALKGFDVTDMMQKAVFDYLRKHFEGRIILTRINADITQIKRIGIANMDKKSSSLDNKKNNTVLNIQQEIERVFELASTMQLVVLDSDAINHPSQIAKTCLAPLLIYIKIISLKVLSRLIKNRGKSQKHNANFQISAAEKLQQCSDESFDLILDQNNLTGATDCLRHFLETYWTATHPSHLKSKADRILGHRDNSGRKPSKQDADYTGSIISQMGINAGFSIKDMNSLVGSSLSWIVKDPETNPVEVIHDEDQFNIVWGGDPEEYRSDREMRVDQKDRNSLPLNDLKACKNDAVTPLRKPVPPEVFISKVSLKSQLLSHTATSNHMAPITHENDMFKVYTSRSVLQQKQQLAEMGEKRKADKEEARLRRKQIRINIEQKREDV